MSLEGKVLRSFQELLPVVNYGPEDSVLVTDTSFLVALSNLHLWAWHVFAAFKTAVGESKLHATIDTPRRIAEQYARLHEEHACDEFGIPLAHESLDQFMGSSIRARMFYGRAAEDEAVDAWQGWQRARHKANEADAAHKRRSAGQADTDILAAAIAIAKKGAEVYVASSDFKDIVSPLESMAEQFRSEGLSIKVLRPSPIGIERLSALGAYFESGMAVTGGVISQLQAANVSNISYPLVVFEKGVRSGNAVFDAAVGVVQKEYLVRVKLPSCLETFPTELVPVFKVKSFEGLSEKEEDKVGKKMANFIQQFSTRKLILVDESNPYFPIMCHVSDLPGQSRHTFSFLRADINFLYYHSTSAFAKANYKPVSQGT